MTKNLTENIDAVKKLLPAEDILVSTFECGDGRTGALVYADGMVNKQLLGELAVRPLAHTFFKDADLKATDEKNQNGGGRVETNAFKTLPLTEESVRHVLLFPELKLPEPGKIASEILDGNTLLLIDGLQSAIVIGAKLVPNRAVAEPPTDVAIKGPREGFIEDTKTNMALVRKRLKTEKLRFELIKAGEKSDSNIAIVYLDGVADKKIVQAVKEKLSAAKIDVIADSAYIADFLAERKHSVFRQIGTTEKPDIFADKLAEGRVGLLVEGSPIALTVPYVLTEDLQSSEDYFIFPFAATIFRSIRLIALFISTLVPAFYISSQLFKVQLLPVKLTLTIAGSTKDLPLSPSLEMFLVLFIFEVLKEASVRMPKYVGTAMSIVGALVLGEAAVSAGFLSIPAIIVIAFSGICLYTVPGFNETGSLLRWAFLIVAGSIGPFGIVLLAAFLLYYLLGAESFGVPLLAPFSPLTPSDLRDTAVKYGMSGLRRRPSIFGSPDKTRFSAAAAKNKAKEGSK